MGKSRRQYSQKQKLDILESGKEVGIRKAAELAGVHFTTVYDWKKELEAKGEEAFLAYKVQSKGRGIKRISEAQEKGVMEMWERYPGFGPSQIRNQLRRQGVTISTRSVRSIMEAGGYQTKTKKDPAKEEDEEFEAVRPLELVQIDILEFFIHKLKVYLILMLDDFSRFLLGWRLLQETTIDDIIGLTQEAMDRYGKMEEVISDRGFVFYSWKGANRFELFLQSAGVDQTHAAAHHPKTLGKIEAVNKQIQKELLRRRKFSSVKEAQQAIGEWVEIFNYQRTHQGLGGCLVPSDRFHGRTKQVLECIREGIDPEAQGCYDIKKIDRSLFNVVLEDNGQVSIYLLGRQIKSLGVDQ